MHSLRTFTALRAAAALTALALAASTGAQAADASASVQITGLSIVADSGVTLSWLPSSSFQSLYAESREAGGLGGNDLQEPASSAWATQAIQTSTGHASASASASASGLGGVLASASRALVNPLALPHSSASWLQQSGEFSLSGAGHVSLVVDYSVSVSAPTSDGSDTWAYGALTVSFGNLFSGLSQTELVSVFSADPLFNNGSPSGRLTLAADFAGPAQTGYYDLRLNAGASAVAAVPEPAHWALVLAGLATLALRQRRRQRSGH